MSTIPWAATKLSSSPRCEPPPVFILTAPRSGSTLLRVMLEGHSMLFSPPELNLLPFCTLGERECCLAARAYRVMGCDERVGLTEAVMSLLESDVETSQAWIQQWVDANVTTACMYWILRRLAAPRRLVDKSTINASHPAFLAQSQQIAPCAAYVHLTRHPYAVIESLVRTYGDPDDPASATVSEELWTRSQRNICAFLDTVEPHRKIRVRFEDLVSDPRGTMMKIASFLGLEYEPAMLDPYASCRMTTGSPGRFDSLGDPNFHERNSIDASLGNAWRRVDQRRALGLEAVHLATALEYVLAPADVTEDEPNA